MIGLQEDIDKFEVILQDAKVNQVILDFRLSILIVDSDDEKLHIVIESPFSVRTTTSASTPMVDPGGSTPMLGTIVLMLRHRQITKCCIMKYGSLSLEFGDDLAIEVPPDKHYEAWDLDCKLFKLLAMPGGEVAFWDRSG
jgi:Family of unknown function (DUF6188)